MPAMIRRPPRAARLARTPRRMPPPREVPGRALYVYGVVRADEPLRQAPAGLGPDPAPVRLVPHRGLAAIVGDVTRGTLQPTRDNLLAHERVNEAIVRQRTVLPMAFGTTFADQDDVVELLRGGYEAFRRALRRVDGHVEFGVKLFCDREELGRALERDRPDLRRLHDELEAHPAENGFARMQYERALQRAVEQVGDEASRQILARLGEIATDLRVERPLGERVVLHVAALVARKREPVFTAKLSQLGHEFERLSLRCTGPWAPYSFVNLRLHVEQASRARAKRARG